MGILDKNQKMEPRGENEPKYNPNNATDRKIVRTVIWTSILLTVVIIALFIVYFTCFQK